MMIEGLIAVAGLALLALWGLMKLIDECLEKWRHEKANVTYTRWLLRNNANQLIEKMSYEDDAASLEMLRVAYAETMGQYRGIK